MDMTEFGVVFPMATVEIVFGLAPSGEQVVISRLLAGDGELVDLVTGLGMLEMTKMELVEKHLRLSGDRG